ncbi:RagB/SusD family nutrient uptake outer membrane protein [Adhaeribacter arboris]|uniref:RagB/SusD family nutrient uptake outer membrane protein n=1 Tax=Adhaeribacter arboris TaxID=2072846 RepID=A0A2T2YFI3_9BACT|nr:RagB/SusD family nutrient uptake outer membrane protein [Adhaeribacter arboris]PSR54271.1 RagB/SusD family nutrient uptake outer membrane protein [Adhaeribacter arboris]
MKFFKNTRYILPFVLTLSLASCDNFLEVEPRQAIVDDQTIVDGVTAETAVRGLYGALAGANYYGTNFQSIGYFQGDNIQWTGSQSIVAQFINHNVTADNATVASTWAAIYQTINRANHIIEKVPAVTDATFTQEKKNQLLGEAYFVRALAYFDLARTWGGVQLVLTPTKELTDNERIRRSSVTETYAQVLKDLTEAEKLLSETTNRYRATKKTAWALLARYYLYQKDWAQAETYASKLVDDAANYKLVKPYSAFFANNARGTEESVFEIYYSPTSTNTHRNSWQPPANGGTRQWAPNDAFVNLVNDPTVGGNRNALVAKTAQGLWYGNMYYRSPATDPTFVIRIAELFLIRAEARAQLNKLPEALADLNAVRSRADLAPSPAITQPEVLLAIENERRVEFAFEPHRWFDLIRTGRVAEVLGVTDANKYVLPIPIDQLNADKALEQNPGY